MKSVVIEDEKKASIVDNPVPRAIGEFVVVKIIVAPMCTEAKSYTTGQMHHPLGHEASGEVVETAQSGRVSPGDRVVVMPQYPCGTCHLCLLGDYIYCENDHVMNEVNAGGRSSF